MIRITTLAVAALFASATASAAPTMWATGTCPGDTGGPAFISISNVPPGTNIALARGNVRGSTTINNGPCPGMTLGLQSPRLVSRYVADANGFVFIDIDLPGQACNTFLQAVDLDRCELSNVAEIVGLY